jgi:hypothetical protein
MSFVCYVHQKVHHVLYCKENPVALIRFYIIVFIVTGTYFGVIPMGFDLHVRTFFWISFLPGAFHVVTFCCN